MQATSEPNDLGIAERIIRTSGRASRRTVVSTKVTRHEQKELESAARREGKVLSEWAREVLLEKARSGPTGTAIFTELLALRLLMNGVLRSIVTDEKLSPQAYQQLVTEVRTTKHAAARDVLTQYINQEGSK